MKNSIHYYPYAYFTKEQSTILWATALYFDLLDLLAHSNATYQHIGIRDIQKSQNPWLKNNRFKTSLTLSATLLLSIAMATGVRSFWVGM